MKIALFNENRVGVVDGSNIIDITELTAWNNGEPQASLVRLMGEFEALKPKIEAGLSSCPVYPVSDVALRAPVPNPSKIVAAPINYILHKQEMNTALTVDGLGFFLKSPSSIIGPDQTVLLPFRDRRVDHEAEIAFVVGKEAKDVKAEDASKYIFGYLALMDITVRGKEDRPWRKSFDTFTPIGPWIVTGDEVENPNQLQMDLWVNDEIRQSANTRALIYDCYKFFEAASSVMTLLPGDIVTTGTPEGVAPIAKGDTVRIHIERIGEFRVQVDYKPGI
ncbi:fumarylacetoacetate hydrolase family protein [Bacillus benzoevorans]|uniref:2-keto-4-pentenoate hydratase/2-oxohepta-3-ene-1,7-dioic acid hydratase in catechol pathway n=1 Tax=Bacillus benzoevorans TaxID=1456 RepID=A0A7X0LUJ6_9BACI|nr:fumarylacetoacetate hydrolase family protein [Bacillus benzoevorans]MBB6444505.1 2-keto-4-pentenoate hydratase/2-oxohepta-3-ene-1,7-dioic acid hydratase in catechol pathway [Bacillus benzoevorans]